MDTHWTHGSDCFGCLSISDFQPLICLLFADTLHSGDYHVELDRLGKFKVASGALHVKSDSTTHDIFVGNAATYSYMDAGDTQFTNSYA